MFGYRGYGHNLSNFLGLDPKTAEVVNIDSTNKRKMHRLYIKAHIYVCVLLRESNGKLPPKNLPRMQRARDIPVT